MPTHVYLDDCRIPPEGWTLVKTAPEAIALLARGGVTHLSLDQNLGDEPGVGKGSDVLRWMAEQVERHGFAPPPFIRIHSGDVVARPRMEAAVAAIRRAARERDEGSR